MYITAAVAAVMQIVLIWEIITLLYLLLPFWTQFF